MANTGTQWLVSRGFVASTQNEVELSPATVGHLDRFSTLLDIQRAALAKEKSKQNGAIIVSHVNAATPPSPQRPDKWSDARNLNTFSRFWNTGVGCSKTKNSVRVFWTSKRAYNNNTYTQFFKYPISDHEFASKAQPQLRYLSLS